MVQRRWESMVLWFASMQSFAIQLFTTSSLTVEYHSIWPLCLPDLITYLPNSFKVGSSRIYADATNIIFRASDLPDLETQINKDLKKAWIFG